MRRVPSGLAGLSGLGGASEQPAKRQKRADVLDSLGGLAPLGGLSRGSNSRSGSAVPSGGRAVAGIGGFGKNASAADLDAMKAWLSDADADGGGSKPAKPLDKDDVGCPKSSSSTASPQPVPTADTGSAGSEKRELNVASEASGDKQVPEVASAPLKLTEEMATQAPYSIFAGAKDCWHVEEASERCTYWHSESGCCFEWHQSVGILLQYAEKQENGSHAKFPIWSLDCPEENSWIWDSLPLPPTDPAADQSTETAEQRPDPVDDSTGADVQGATGSSASSSSSPGGIDAIASMLPPPLPVKKKMQPKDNEVLDDNPFEKKCRAREVRAAARETSSSSSSGSSSLASTEKDSCSGSIGPLLSGREAVGTSEGDIEASGETLSSMVVGRGLLDDSDDEDIAGPSLAEGPAPLLPPAPSDKAKPKACDLELDMFGEPEENTMEAVD